MENTKTKITRAQSNRNIESALFAIHIGDLQTLSALVHTRAQANWLSPDRCGLSLLCTAVLHRQRHIVKWLLEMGADPNTVFFERRRFAFPPVDNYSEGHYKSPLLTAINWSDVEMIALLLEHGASLDLPIFVDYLYECEFCSDLLFRLQIEEPVKARREAMQIAKAISATATPSTAGKARL